jgi:hypothetical protein
VDVRQKIIVEVDPNCEPIVGQIRDGDGDETPFSGWLGLAAALSAAQEAAGAGRRPEQETPEETP